MSIINIFKYKPKSFLFKISIMLLIGLKRDLNKKNGSNTYMNSNDGSHLF